MFRSVIALLILTAAAAQAGAPLQVSGLQARGVLESRDGGVELSPQRLYDSSIVLRQSAMETPANLGDASGRKDPRLAMLYSLILPGLGEYWLGHKNRAAAFFVAEAGIWTAYGVFQTQGSHRKELYQEYAADLAGVPVRDDDEFYRIIGNFPASEGPFSANENVRRQARAIFPNDRSRQEQYVEENGYFGDDSWMWQSQEEQERYLSMRRGSLDAYNNADLTLGLLVANRLVSIVDAGVLAARHNRALERDGASLSWDVNWGPGGPGARVVLARDF